MSAGGPTRRRLLQLGVSAEAANVFPIGVRAHGWPSKPIRLVVSFAPGQRRRQRPFTNQRRSND